MRPYPRTQVTNKVDGKHYVIKEIDISRMPKAEREASQQEARLLMALRHPNIGAARGSPCCCSKLLAIITHVLAPNGDDTQPRGALGCPNSSVASIHPREDAPSLFHDIVLMTWPTGATTPLQDAPAAAARRRRLARAPLTKFLHFVSIKSGG